MQYSDLPFFVAFELEPNLTQCTHVVTVISLSLSRTTLQILMICNRIIFNAPNQKKFMQKLKNFLS